MTTIRKMILTGALLAAAAPALAEDAHHPGGVPAKPAAAAPMMGGQAGMMGKMMGPGAMPMMPMMESMMQMMAPEHVEGRIAFLKAELKITDAQQPLWNAFADALRASARGMSDTMKDMQGSMMPSQTEAGAALPQRIEQDERMLASRLDSLHRLKTALLPLYSAFDESQKQVADKLLSVGPMGLM